MEYCRLHRQPEDESAESSWCAIMLPYDQIRGPALGAAFSQDETLRERWRPRRRTVMPNGRRRSYDSGVGETGCQSTGVAIATRAGGPRPKGGDDQVLDVVGAFGPA